MWLTRRDVRRHNIPGIRRVKTPNPYRCPEYCDIGKGLPIALVPWHTQSYRLVEVPGMSMEVLQNLQTYRACRTDVPVRELPGKNTSGMVLYTPDITQPWNDRLTILVGSRHERAVAMENHLKARGT